MKPDTIRVVAVAGIIVLIVVSGLAVISQQPNRLKQGTAANNSSQQELALAEVTDTSTPLTSQASPTAQLSQHRPAVSARPTTTLVPIPTVVPPGVENLPLYSGARDMKYDNSDPREQQNIIYKTDATLDQVVAFYKEQLTKQGWILAVSVPNSEPDVAFYCVWGDPKGIAPWNLWLSLAISTIKTSDASQSDKNSDKNKGVAVQLRLMRIPSLKRIPIYPDAQQVEVKEIQSSMFANPREAHLITYITDATPDVIEAYYRTILPAYAWNGPTTESITSEHGFAASGGVGGVEHASRVLMYVVAKPLSDGRTKIEMEVNGTIVNGQFSVEGVLLP